MKDYMHDRIFDIIKHYFVVSDYKAAHKVTDGIIKSYNEPHRKYHTINHIAKCLDMVNEVFTFDVVQVNNILTAIIYHDIVYNPFSTDKRNEKNSAIRFTMDIPNIISHHSGEVIRYMILATTHDPKDMVYPTMAFRSMSSYQEYICDIDLHQLGCGLNEFLYN
jgi:predicted metal-dependent HD superfamily phosphohydrolase